MKSTHDLITNGLFGGVVATIADSLGQTRQFLPAGSAGPAAGLDVERRAGAASPPGMLARFGSWIWRRQMTGIAPQLARSRDVFDRLDRWMWRQHMREVESYLAKSQDVFDLERRIKHLERGSDARFC